MTRPPARIVHLGLGGFFRAHQAWYTGAAPDAGGWGITAFTGRSRGLADRLTRQDGRYTLVVRGRDGDTMSVQRAVVEALPGDGLAAWCARLARPEVAVLTLTVTEAAYRLSRDGGLDLDDPHVRADVAALSGGRGLGGPHVQADVAALSGGRGLGDPHVQADVAALSGGGLGDPHVQADVTALRGGGEVVTVPGRLVAGLAARRAAAAGPLAVVCCDNLPGNGTATAHVVTELAETADPALAAWIRAHVSFVTTMVDRITPRTTEADILAVAARTGWADAVPVVTEPFTEWVLAGDFPGGRPGWEAAGARFVADVHPYETRKLLLLNGGHSLLAYAGSALGHDTVAAAIADPRCRAWLEQWWDEAARHVPLPAAELRKYRAALVERFGNPRMRHLLAQIAADGSQKIPIRVLPVVRAERTAGRLPTGGARILAAWIAHLRGAGAPVDDAAAGPYRDRAGSARDVLALLAPDLATDAELLDAIGP